MERFGREESVPRRCSGSPALGAGEQARRSNGDEGGKAEGMDELGAGRTTGLSI